MACVLSQPNLATSLHYCAATTQYCIVTTQNGKCPSAILWHNTKLCSEGKSVCWHTTILRRHITIFCCDDAILCYDDKRKCNQCRCYCYRASQARSCCFSRQSVSYVRGFCDQPVKMLCFGISQQRFYDLRSQPVSMSRFSVSSDDAMIFGVSQSRWKGVLVQYRGIPI